MAWPGITALLPGLGRGRARCHCIAQIALSTACQSLVLAGRPGMAREWECNRCCAGNAVEWMSCRRCMKHHEGKPPREGRGPRSPEEAVGAPWTASCAAVRGGPRPTADPDDRHPSRCQQYRAATDSQWPARSHSSAERLATPESRGCIRQLCETGLPLPANGLCAMRDGADPDSLS